MSRMNARQTMIRRNDLLAEWNAGLCQKGSEWIGSPKELGLRDRIEALEKALLDISPKASEADPEHVVVLGEWLIELSDGGVAPPIAQQIGRTMVRLGQQLECRMRVVQMFMPDRAA